MLEISLKTLFSLLFSSFFKGAAGGKTCCFDDGSCNIAESLFIELPDTVGPGEKKTRFNFLLVIFPFLNLEGLTP